MEYKKSSMHATCGECGICTENKPLRDIALPGEKDILSISDLFKVFGDTTRLRILIALFRAPMCGSHLSEQLGMTKPAVSYQLKILRRHDLVRAHRSGKNVIYHLSDDHVREIIDCAMEHVNE